MSTKYLVAVSGTVTWSTSNVAIWSATSGGTPGAVSAPIAGDDVIIDANSGTGTVLRTSTVSLNSLTMTPSASNPITYSGTANNTVKNTLTVNSNITWTNTGTLTLGASSTTCTVNSSVNITSPITIFASATNTVQMTCAGTAAITQTNGSFTLSSSGVVASITQSGGTQNLSSSSTVTAFTLSTGTLTLGSNVTIGTLQYSSGTINKNSFVLTALTFATAVSSLIHDSTMGIQTLVIQAGSYTFNSSATFSGSVTISGGNVSLGGSTITCWIFSQSAGSLAFGTGGKIITATSMTSSGGSVSGTGQYQIVGVNSASNAALSGIFTLPMILSGTLNNVTISATVTTFDSSSLTAVMSGSLAVQTSAVFGNVSCANLNITTPASSNVTLSGYSGRTLGTVTPGSFSTISFSSYTAMTALNLPTGATVSFPGVTISAGTISVSTSSGGAATTFAFGTGGCLTITGGLFNTAGLNDGITTTTGTGSIILSGATSNSFTITTGSFSNITLKIGSAVVSTISTYGVELADITNTVGGATIKLNPYDTSPVTVRNFTLSQCLVTGGSLAYSGSGTINIYNCLISQVTATPAATWFAQGANGCIDAGGNSGIAFGSAYTGPKADRPVYIGKRRFYT